MSSPIWTECGGKRNRVLYEGRPWRVVEAQHRISPRRLVDTDEEQAILEELLDRTKPPVPADCEGLHYLLFSPFRYPPLRRGSRFGTRHERSIFYGSEKLSTAMAEVAYYRLLFLEGTAAPLEPLVVDLSAFRVSVRTEEAIDLRAPPFDAWEEEISSPVSYAISQPLGRAMRADGIELARFRSARDPVGGTNLAIFSPTCFVRKRPTVPETWLCVATRREVECSRRSYFERQSLRFPREVFEVEGRLPAPAVE